MNRYPDSDSTHLCRLFAASVGAAGNEVIAGVGCDEIIGNILDAFMEKEDVVLSLNPTFSMYETLTVIAGGRYHAIGCDENFVPDVEHIIDTANKLQAKILFLCSPNNPTGYTFSQAQLRRILDATSCLVVLDEVYADYAKASCLHLYQDYERLIVLRTLSKAFSLAGIRVGFGIAQAKTMQYLYRVKVPYNVNVLSQAAAQIALSNVELIYEHTAQTIQRRQALIEELKQIKEIITYPSQSNFILIKVDDRAKYKSCADKHGIALKYFSNKILQNHIRITVGSTEENAALISMLKEASQP